MQINEKYMNLALELAEKGIGNVNPNPMVGAVVVKDNKIIGKGYHKFYGGPHAEVYALEEAGDDAKGADIYVTLEPCSHFGKTPPCAEKIIKFGIKRCIIAMKDPNPLVSGKGIDLLKKAGIEVIEGVLEEKSNKLNEVFLKFINKKVPFVFLKTAITLDGKIATKTGDSKWISNEKARERVQYLRHKYMGILVGINTVLKDNPRLNARIENGKDPYRIIIDPNLRIELDKNIILNNNDEKTILITRSKNKLKIKYKELLDKKVKFIFLDEDKFEIDKILCELGKLKIDSIFVEGGGTVLSNFFKSKLIDKGLIFIAPKIIGDSESIPFVNGFNIGTIKEGLSLKNPNYEIFENNIAIHFNGIL